MFIGRVPSFEELAGLKVSTSGRSAWDLRFGEVGFVRWMEGGLGLEV